MNLEEMGLKEAESKATYEEIRAYVKEHFGLHVTNLYIAQVKRELGIIERINYHIGGGKAKVPQVRPEKRKLLLMR